MSEGKLLKYRVVAALTEFELQDKLNILAGEGYILHQFAINNDPQSNMQQSFYAVMKLGDDNNYENVTNVRDISPELVDEAISLGWTPGSLSLSTKFVRMIRRKQV